MAFRIEHRIGVQAPASQVWGILSDLKSWREWNPLYPEASGRLSIGAPLAVTLALPGEKPRPIAPVVLDWVPDSQILWNLKAVGGLVRTTRYLEIQTLSETGCVFSNGEIFEGFGAGFIPKRLRAAIRRGFTQMGEAMKTRAEAAWRENGAGSEPR